jgi:two-component system, sensor histidine kinase and response regulator
LKTILIVEDEKDVRMNLQDLLETESYNVLVAKDGNEGVKLAANNLPDLILSDIKMPKLNGFEFFKTLQKDPFTASIPFIFLTAKVEMSDFREGMSLGADDYLTKPFKAEDVLRAIEVRLQKKEQLVEEVQKLKNDLLKKVPHELRTPLVSILGCSELIEDDLDLLSKEELRSLINKIKLSGRRLHRRIEKFLIYSELLSIQDKDKLFDSMLNELQIDTDRIERQITITIGDFNRENDLEICLEEASLKIHDRYYDFIVNELVENALKYSPYGSKVIVEGAVDGDYYNTKVIDEGPGMISGTVARIDLFRQFGIEKEFDEGNGLGLALIQKIIMTYGGYLRINNNENKKNIVEFGIPLIHQEVMQ